MSHLQALKDMRASYRKAFTSEEGTKVLKDLNRYCLLNDTTFHTDALQMAFNEGARSVALYIKKVMEAEDGLQRQEEGEEVNNG